MQYIYYNPATIDIKQVVRIMDIQEISEEDSSYHMFVWTAYRSYKAAVAANATSIIT